MQLSAACPRCGKEYAVSASLAGKTVKCRACATVFTLPAATMAPRGRPGGHGTPPLPSTPEGPPAAQHGVAAPGRDAGLAGRRPGEMAGGAAPASGRAALPASLPSTQWPGAAHGPAAPAVSNFPAANPAPAGYAPVGHSRAEDLEDSIHSASNSRYAEKPLPPRPKYTPRFTGSKVGVAAGGAVGGSAIVLLLILRIVLRVNRAVNRYQDRDRDPPTPDYRTSPEAASALRDAGGGTTFDLPRPSFNQPPLTQPRVPVPEITQPPLPRDSNPLGPGDPWPDGFGPGGIGPGGTGPGGFGPGGFGPGGFGPGGFGPGGFGPGEFGPGGIGPGGVGPGGFGPGGFGPGGFGPGGFGPGGFGPGGPGPGMGAGSG